jgi:hypothetical protein
MSNTYCMAPPDGVVDSHTQPGKQISLTTSTRGSLHKGVVLNLIVYGNVATPLESSRHLYDRQKSSVNIVCHSCMFAVCAILRDANDDG